jgi:hypothetical protein
MSEENNKVLPVAAMRNKGRGMSAAAAAASSSYDSGMGAARPSFLIPYRHNCGFLLKADTQDCNFRIPL